MFLVAGLGNPGAQYVGTRHNVGFLAADALARRCATGIDKSQHGALSTKVRLAGQAVVLCKPQKFMNLSGGPTQQLAAFYKVELDHVIVVHDELDLPFGDVRVKVGGGHGGHNGLRDLHKHLPGNGYVRVRVGIGRPPAGWKPANYVLGRWSAEESSQLEDVVARAADAVESVVRVGPTETMNQFNVRAGDRSPTPS
jgi:PTH1 family peptidyl-tRNA hydrolase